MIIFTLWYYLMSQRIQREFQKEIITKVQSFLSSSTNPLGLGVREKKTL